MPNIVRIDGDLLSSSKINAANAWIKAGAKVLALHGIDDSGQCTCGKAKCKSPGKHPLSDEFPKGQHSATRRRAKIASVFKAHPNTNLGVVLPENFIVLDVDGPEGQETFDRLNLPKTATVQTGRGTHHYFRSRQALPIKRQRLVGIDIKDSTSGYLVVPPSRHRSGKQYRSKRGSTPKIAVLPLGFINGLKPERSRTVSFDQSSMVSKGGRNNALASYAGYFRYKGLSDTAIGKVLGALNHSICRPPLDDDEVANIAQSIGNYDAGFENAFGSLADVEEEEVQFLAHPYIVKGATTVLDGNMG